MPRIARGLADNLIYHILNRGNGGQQIFHKHRDYEAFVELMLEAKTKFQILIFGHCLMPNHFHMVVQPRIGEHLSMFMQWFMTSHVRRYHQHYRSSGHIWQGRFKSFIIQGDGHLIAVLRYGERNPVRAGLVGSAKEWIWSSHRENCNTAPQRLIIDEWPIEKQGDWGTFVDQPQTDAEIESIRHSIIRQSPFGDSEWKIRISNKFGLASTLRPRGRPLYVAY